jgi:ABC-type glycerol-3-phosphate transport system substrate-binding protein
MKTKVVMLAAAIMLAACGGGGDGNNTGGSTPASSPPPVSAPVARYDANLTGQNYAPDPSVFVKFGNAPFLDGSLYSVTTSFPDSSHVQMDFASLPNWSGNIVFRNNTTGVSVVMSKATSPAQTTVWQATTNPQDLIRNGVTDSFTVQTQ